MNTKYFREEILDYWIVTISSSLISDCILAQDCQMKAGRRCETFFFINITASNFLKIPPNTWGLSRKAINKVKITNQIEKNIVIFINFFSGIGTGYLKQFIQPAGT